MRAMPGPGALDYLIKVATGGLPSKLALDAFGTRYEHRRVARPARPSAGGDRATGYAASRGDHFLNRMTPLASEVISAAAALKPAKGQYVRVREIHYVYIIAYAGSVRG